VFVKVSYATLAVIQAEV